MVSSQNIPGERGQSDQATSVTDSETRASSLKESLWLTQTHCRKDHQSIPASRGLSWPMVRGVMLCQDSARSLPLYTIEENEAKSSEGLAKMDNGQSQIWNQDDNNPGISVFSNMEPTCETHSLDLRD